MMDFAPLIKNYVELHAALMAPAMFVIGLQEETLRGLDGRQRQSAIIIPFDKKIGRRSRQRHFWRDAINATRDREH